MGKIEEATFHLRCRGRDARHHEVLENPVDISVRVYHRNFNDAHCIHTQVECPHIGGGHGDHCRATGLRDIDCPYVASLPYALDGGEINFGE